MVQTFGRRPCVCAGNGLFGTVWWYFLLLSVYKSPPGVFQCAMEWVIHAAPLLISVTSCFSPTQKMLRWFTQKQTAINNQKIIIVICVHIF